MSQILGRSDYMNLEDFEELLGDRPHDERWELIDRRVVKLMVEARWDHHLIIQNLAFGTRQQLQAKRSPCRVISETFYLESKSVESSTLPDIMVRCGPIPRDAVSFDDPTVLVEVISPGSDERDRSEKWKVYRRFASLQHYVLIERDDMQVDVLDRSGDVWTNIRRLTDPTSIRDLPAIGVSILLAEIYRDVLTP